MNRPSDAMLAYVRKLAPVPDEEWRFARTLFRPRRLGRGEYLTREGDVAVEFGWVLRGLVRKYYLGRNDGEVVRGFAAEGQLAGAYASLLSGAPSLLNVQALEETDLLVMDYSDFVQLYERHVCWQQLGRKVAESLLLEREEREHQLLRMNATDRYLSFRREQGDLVGRVPQHQIAAYLGITPVSLSRIIGQLKGRF
ncbi:Crp/Fnr family transcriptional regulator [Vulgatibacter incomptus]|uniref:cAMP-binding protein n=1 Tax=Vulgatibacter incomptus TaxID=1391653 RepID=A0A0K1PG31_9BACT|nr:Crp/Fnr family transcriptional regulator [Vulgatibacter incomptus]AKU92475.1 cAMP-binding protein [Vulgatibacter incomptus]